MKIDYATKLIRISGETIEMTFFKGKVLLIVNTASRCGYTPQYAGLQR
ncbi:MAG TPA: glutathione peroxidase, partial [Gammaproteobacteria bacterium]|nr:glutathione peroxidase [Gammaproteobacteria bacterium]